MDAYHGHAHLLEKVGVISCMFKNRTCSTEGVRIGEKGPFESMFLPHPLTHPKSFHDLILPIKRTMPSCFLNHLINIFLKKEFKIISLKKLVKTCILVFKKEKNELTK